MQLHLHELDSCAVLLDGLHQKDVVYGTAPDTRYQSLLSPASASVSEHELEELQSDLTSLANLYRIATDLYLDSIGKPVDGWIQRTVEHGLTPAEVEVTRRCAAHRQEPKMMRVDYVEVEPDRRKLAEVQWKSGGPGFLLGHEAVYRSLYPLGQGQHWLPDPVTRYLSRLLEVAPRSEPVLANEARSEWLRGERQVQAVASSIGVDYIPLDRSALTQLLHPQDDGVPLVETAAGPRRIGVLRGRGFTEQCGDRQLLSMAEAAIEGRLWIETPLNFIYRQKWVMCLPFLDEYRDLFDERLREILIPSAMFTSGMDLAYVASALPGAHRDRLTEVSELTDLLDLPESTRECIVIKCGSGVGELQSGGRGVFRLTGSRSAARKTLEGILERVHRLEEPWIIQPYIDSKYQLPVALPGREIADRVLEGHARIMAFGGRSMEGHWELDGMIANFARSWKVSGSAGAALPSGELTGSVFIDVRLQK